MIRLVLFLLVPILFLVYSNEKNVIKIPVEHDRSEKISDRYVEGNTIISKNLPEIEIEVADEFKYVGVFDFEIFANSDEYPAELQGKAVAAGERFVFAMGDEDRNVKKLFIVQFEGFLEENEFIFNYNFDNAEYIGKNKYRQNSWFYDSASLAEENPYNEGAKTRTFLKDKGFLLEDEYMMSRFVGLASEDRKHEIIIFYIEMLHGTTGYSLKEYENSISKEEADSIRTALVERSRNSFKITKG